MWIKNAKLALQFASVLTAMSFLASALAYALIFAIWGLDFTALASVDDVIMGGIRLFFFALPVGLILFLYRLADEMLSIRMQGKRGRWAGRWLVFSAALGSLLLNVVLNAGFDMWGHDPVRRHSWLTVILFQICGAMALVLIMSFFHPFHSRLDLLRRATRILISEARFHSLVTIASTSIVVMIGFSLAHYEDLTIDSGVAMPPQCVTLGVAVRWIGSRSIVVTCGSDSFVFANSDKVVLRFRAPPP